jgi:hypothetical protein
MASYLDRLTADLDRWIAEGLVPPENRDPMLAMVAKPKTTDASTALAMIGALLIGAAVIAMVAANWDVIPRIGRFAILIVTFLAAAGGAAFAGAKGRPNAANGLLTVAAAIYAASIGLTGQIFDIAGDPKTAAIGAGLAAALLALVGRSSGAAIAALVLIGIGDFAEPNSGWLLLAGLAAVAAAWAWRSTALAQAAGVAVIVGLFTALMTLYPGQSYDHTQEKAFIAAGLLAIGAGGMRLLRGRDRAEPAIFYGWWVWGALCAFAAGGLSMEDWGVAHRIAWLLISGGVIALGRHDRHGLVTAAGVLSLIGAMSAVMFDLGLDLIFASVIFGIAALVALAAGWLLRGRKSA